MTDLHVLIPGSKITLEYSGDGYYKITEQIAPPDPPKPEYWPPRQGDVWTDDTNTIYTPGVTGFLFSSTGWQGISVTDDAIARGTAAKRGLRLRLRSSRDGFFAPHPKT